MSDLTKKVAIEISGCSENLMPHDYYTPSPEQRFDAMWPSEREKYMRRAERILRMKND